MFQRMKSVQVFGFLFLGLLLIGFVFSFSVYLPVRAATNHHALYQKKGIITLPDVSSSWNFDGGYVDSQRGLLYQSDFSNKRVDIVRLSTRKVISMLKGFTGPGPDPHNYSQNGPNHVIGIGQMLVVSNGDSTVRFYNMSDPTHPLLLETVSTEGKFRADAMAFDPDNHLLAVVNGNDPIPFLSFIDTHSRKIIKQIHFDKRSGLEASALDDIEFDKVSDHFFLTLTGTASSHPYGAVVEIGSKIATPGGVGPAIVRVHHIPYMCGPNGLALARRNEMSNLDIAIACDGNPMILHIHRDQDQFSLVGDTNGGDFVTSVADGHAFAFAEYGNPGGSALIITSTSGTVLQEIPTAPISHSIFSDEDGTIYIPQAGQGVVIFTCETN